MYGSASYEFFGCSVAISGDYAFIGDYGYSTETGAVFVYEHDPLDADTDGNYWELKQTLGDSISGDKFDVQCCVRELCNNRSKSL